MYTFLIGLQGFLISISLVEINYCIYFCIKIVINERISFNWECSKIYQKMPEVFFGLIMGVVKLERDLKKKNSFISKRDLFISNIQKRDLGID